MRKISILSLIAVLSATPMMAEAARTVTKENYSAPTANTDVASTSYVQGAYKAASDRINALVDDTAVASAESGTYVAVSADSTVGENLQALDSRVKSLETATSANLSEAINSLTATVSQTTGDINISVAEQSGVLTSVSANIIDSAVTTAKIADSNVTTSKIADDAVTADKIAQNAVGTSEIADGSVAFIDMNGDAVVTATEGISSTVDGASDSALVTEKAVAAAISAINGDATALESRVEDNEGAIAVLNGNAETAGSVANAAATTLQSANAYTDNKRLEVFTTWGSATSSAIELSNAN